jgi:RNA polymerase sigma-70 factor (ECF subfamily)
MNSVFKREVDNTLKVTPLATQISSEPSDEMLISRFAKGSTVSFELLVQRYKKRIFEFIYFQIKQHRHDAEDLTQDVFVELYKKVGNFRHESKFSTYLFSIAKNIVLNYFRSNSRFFSFSQLLNKSEDVEIINLHDQLSNEAEQKQILLAINSLSADERQIIYLCDKENFSYLQVSEILNIKLGTVRSRLSTARQKVISALRDN